MPTTQKKRLGKSLIAIVAGTILAIVYATPAFAASHEATILPGSVLSVGNEEFNPGTPACSDGVDNDDDTDVDWPADSDCVDADDASESQSGDQPFTAPTATFDESSGAVTNLDLHFQPAEICDPGTGVCIEAQITGVDGTGTWNSATDAATMNIDVAVELNTGDLPGGDDCQIDVPDADLSGTIAGGDTGTLTGTEPVDALDGGDPGAGFGDIGECGGVLFFVDYAEVINEAVDLPNDADISLNVEVDPDLPS